METNKTNWEKIKTGNVIASLVIIIAQLFPISLLFFEVPNGNKDIFNFLTGAVYSTVLSGAVYYLFGYKKKSE